MITIGAAHLGFTPKQVNALRKNYRKKGVLSGMLHDYVELIESQIEAGGGSHVNLLRDAGLLG